MEAAKTGVPPCSPPLVTFLKVEHLRSLPSFGVKIKVAEFVNIAPEKMKVTADS